MARPKLFGCGGLARPRSRELVPSSTTLGSARVRLRDRGAGRTALSIRRNRLVESRRAVRPARGRPARRADVHAGTSSSRVRVARQGRRARASARARRLAEPVDPDRRAGRARCAGAMSWNRLAATCTCPRDRHRARKNASQWPWAGLYEPISDATTPRRTATPMPPSERRGSRDRCSRGSPASSRGCAARRARRAPRGTAASREATPRARPRHPPRR